MKRSIFLLSALATLISSSASKAVDFNSEVFPILKNRCAKCHMDGESKGKVSLEKKALSKEIGDDGSIIPGDVEGSDLHWTMTLDAGEDLAMPPKGPRVPKAEINLIAKWIEEGAKLGNSGGDSPAPPAMDDTMGGDDMGDSMGDSMGGGEMGMSGGDAMAEAAPKPYKGTFKNVTGKQLKDITLLRVEGDRAILLLPDNKEYRYPINLFAPESQEIVNKFKDGTLQ